jgi:hypothetical protein
MFIAHNVPGLRTASLAARDVPESLTGYANPEKKTKALPRGESQSQVNKGGQGRLASRSYHLGDL